MIHARSHAVLVGYDGKGGILRFSQILSQYGFRHITAVVDDWKRYTRETRKAWRRQGFKVEQNRDLHDPNVLTRIASSLGVGKPGVAFLCAQDGVMLSYLEACRRLRVRSSGRMNVPVEGIRRARLKPAARYCWERDGVDRTRHLLVACEKPDDALASLRRAGLALSNRQPVIVKPVCGVGSLEVRTAYNKRQFVTSLHQIVGCYESSPKLRSMPTQLTVDRRRYRPYRDALVEERLTGSEFTVDGFVVDGKVAFVVQHKETRYLGGDVPGDGLIISPPDFDNPSFSISPDRDLQCAKPCRTPLRVFEEMISKALKSIQIDNWIFHCEVFEIAPGKLRIVELNPRPAGGLLSSTASMHLGLDLIELMVRLHIGVPTVVPRLHTVTGQFPIYATRLGIIKKITGIRAARAISGVENVVTALEPGDRIERLDIENYAAFVSLRAQSHTAVRRAECAARKLLRVEYT